MASFFFLEVVQLFIAHEELLHVYFTESRERMNQSWKKIVFYVISNINLFSFMTSQGAYCWKVYGNVRNVWRVSHGFTQNILGQVQSWFSDGIMVFWIANKHFQFFFIQVFRMGLARWHVIQADLWIFYTFFYIFRLEARKCYVSDF